MSDCGDRVTQVDVSFNEGGFYDDLLRRLDAGREAMEDVRKRCERRGCIDTRLPGEIDDGDAGPAGTLAASFFAAKGDA